MRAHVANERISPELRHISRDRNIVKSIRSALSCVHCYSFLIRPLAENVFIGYPCCSEERCPLRSIRFAHPWQCREYLHHSHSGSWSETTAEFVFILFTLGMCLQLGCHQHSLGIEYCWSGSYRSSTHFESHLQTSVVGNTRLVDAVAQFQ